MTAVCRYSRHLSIFKTCLTGINKYRCSCHFETSRMPIILHENSDSPPCMSVTILAKTIGVELELKRTEYDENLYKEPFHKINPAHTIPALNDNGFCIWESRAIMGYLVQQYAKDDQLYPKEPKKRAKVDNMLHFDVGNLYPSFAEYFYPPPLFGHEGVLEAKDKVKDRLSILNNILSELPYMAGDNLSIADISIRCSLLTPVASGFTTNYNEYPNISKWIERFENEVPAYKDIASVGFPQIKEWFKDGLLKHGFHPNLFHQK